MDHCAHCAELHKEIERLRGQLGLSQSEPSIHTSVAPLQTPQTYNTARTHSLTIISQNVGYAHEVLRGGAKYGRKTCNKIGTIIAQQKPSIMAMQEITATPARYLCKCRLNELGYMAFHSSPEYADDGQIIRYEGGQGKRLEPVNEYEEALMTIIDTKIIDVSQATAHCTNRCLVVQDLIASVRNIQGAPIRIAIINIHASPQEHLRLTLLNTVLHKIKHLERTHEAIILMGDFNSIAAARWQGPTMAPTKFADTSYAINWLYHSWAKCKNSRDEATTVSDSKSGTLDYILINRTDIVDEIRVMPCPYVGREAAVDGKDRYCNHYPLKGGAQGQAP